jgi:carbon-monoxide dehydrogenase iron sulfur subunit
MQKVIAVDPNRCTGCRMCEMACSLHHEQACGRSSARVKVVKLELEGVDMPVLCEHCASAPCMAVCPTGALVRDECTGAVVLLEQLCIGCRMCALACPFGAIGVDPRGERVSILKCDLCGGDPQCVRFCEPGALQFVRRDQLGADKRDAVVRMYMTADRSFWRGSEGGQG